MKISVVVPVFNAANDLRQCLDALDASTRLADEIIVVDDGSTDESVSVAQASGALVISTGAKSRGPAFARNRGAEKASGDIVVFLDADVCVRADALALFEQNFVAQDVAAVFGSYDDTPSAPGLFSGYYNLRHHWTHQHANREAWTFWSGCGAIRRDIFLKLGGFDESYARPCIEDVALGRTLRRAGHRVLVCPEIQATHLKKWSLRSWLRTDIRDRAIPWTRLLLEENNDVPADLNLDWKSRASAVTSWLAVFGIMAGFWNTQLWILAALMLVAQIGFNAPLLAFFARRRGVAFAVGAWVCHSVYFLYSSAIFGVMSIEEKWRNRTVRFRHRVLVLMLAALCKGLLWSVIVPPWQAADEPQHYLYAHEIRHQRTTRIVPVATVPLDAWLLFKLVPRKRAAAGLPLDLSDRVATAKALQEIDASKTRRVLDGGQLIHVRGFVSFHPPFYYGIVAGILSPLAESGVRWQLLTARWFSVLLGVVTTALAIAIGLEIWPQRRDWALVLGVMVAFQPMNSFTQAAITDDALLITLYSALIWCVLRIARKGMTPQWGAAVGLLCAAGLLTKMSFACAMPLLLGLMLWRTARERRCAKRVFGRKRNRSTSTIAGWVLVFTLPVILSGWWYRGAFGNSSGIIQTSFSNGKTLNSASVAKASVGLSWEGALRRKVAQMPIVKDITTYVRIMISYWGNFGWVDVRIPSMLWISLMGLTLHAVFSGLRHLWRAHSRHEYSFVGLETRRSRRAMVWMGAASLALLFFYALVDWRTRVTTGGAFGLRGGYYLPAVAAHMAWLMISIVPRIKSKISRLWLLGSGMVALNFYCLFGIVARRYYGDSALWDVLQNATILHPISHAALVFICSVTIASSTLLVMTLNRFSRIKETRALVSH